MKKRIFLVIAVIVLLLGSLMFGIKCKAGLKTVKIDEIEYNSATVEEDYLNFIKDEYKVFDNNDLNVFVKYDVDLSNITGRSLIQKIIDCFKQPSYSVGYSYTFDKDGIEKYLKKYNKSAIKSEDAYIIKKEKNFGVVDETYGTEVDINKLLSNLVCDYKEVKLSDFYIKPSILADDLQPKITELNNYVNWFCTYSNGNTVSSNIDYVTYENGKIDINTDWISEAINEAVKSYNTVGCERKFVTTNGEEVSISGGTWGSLVDKDAELEILVDAFKKGKCITDKEPIYVYDRDDIGNTYIEVSIKDQHVWVYYYGDLIMDSPCVTGNSSKGHDTPTGMYFISECINGKYLTGDNYKTWVNKWMRLTNSGIGLHDAYWRGSFGGSIYKTNGSHGCVNLPKNFAYDLYDIAYTGMPVIIY